MKTIVFYDTESTGFPNWKEPSGGENQPHIVKLTAIQCDAETRNILQRIELIVRQEEHWGMSPEAFALHGVSVEMSQAVGVSERTAINLLLNLSCTGIRVAHSRTFNQRIIRIGLKRYDFPEDVIEKWGDKETHDCTMLKSKPIMELPQYARYGWKKPFPKLDEAYQFFTGRSLADNAHSSIYKTLACMAVYWGIEDWHVDNEKAAEEAVENPCPKCGKDWPKRDVECPNCGNECPF